MNTSTKTPRPGPGPVESQLAQKYQQINAKAGWGASVTPMTEDEKTAIAQERGTRLAAWVRENESPYAKRLREEEEESTRKLQEHNRLYKEQEARKAAQREAERQRQVEAAAAAFDAAEARKAEQTLIDWHRYHEEQARVPGKLVGSAPPPGNLGGKVEDD